MPLKPLDPSQLRRTTDPANLNFNTTADLLPASDIIGQPRAAQAIEFGIGIDSPGYNIFVLGEEGTGRATAIGRFLNEQAAKRSIPQDWLYVNNFAEPNKPRAINLPAGLGRQLRDDMDSFIDNLKRSLPLAFVQDSYVDARTQIRLDYEAKRDALFSGLQGKAAAVGFIMLSTPGGLALEPIREGKPLTPEEFDALPADEKKTLDATRRTLEGDLETTLNASRGLEKATKDSQITLDQQVAGSVVDRWIDELKGKYLAYPETVFYLAEVRRDVVERVEEFIPTDEPPNPNADPKPNYRRYSANLVVDHSRTQGAPVVVELNPTYGKLLGRVEYEARYGLLVTDFTLIKTGALHAANGGYLVLRAHDVFFEPLAWDALKRSLLSGYVRTEDINGRGGNVTPTRTLEPEPIPLNLKVVLVGPPNAYYDLHSFDDSFASLFKVKADFADEMPRTLDTEKQYAQFVAARCAEEKLLPFDQTAVAKVIEFGARASGDQNKLSVRFGEIADLVREAHYWAKQATHPVVAAADVQKALDEKFYRANKIEELQRARILEGSIFIDTQSKAVGQVNGLTISDPGDYAFGLPARITARTYVGHGGVGHLDRDTGMAGQIHNKGLLTLSSYFSATYAAQRSISFSGQLTFEQNYGTIEGDSASTAELCALLSSLSGYPIKQSLAITGSVNQKGELQPIGAVNEKIEGFFSVCEARGLTGDQGVIIPKSNVQDLMLNEKVVAAVKAGQFRIWAASTVDEAIELFTGVKAGTANKDGRWPEKTIHYAVQKRLRELARGHDRDNEDDEEQKKPSRRPRRKKPAPKQLPIKKIPSKKRPLRRPRRSKKA